VRNAEREIKDRAVILSIIEEAQVCRVAFSAGDKPYIVPMNFGYRDNCLYFHGATEGKKLDMIRQNNEACFEIDINDEIVKATGRLCSWTTKYRSVIGFGKAFIINNWREKSAALNVITRHYGADAYAFTEKDVEPLTIIKIEISSMTGKKEGY
jgi:nitroimidazol reductase NimA-like FMN-containing flavoprotein (pyridoxamine 5'-phosphate oxidase superfamily)